MNKKMVGGIIVLIALVGFVGVFLLISRDTDTDTKKVYKAPSEEVLEKVSGDLTAQKAQDTAKPPPPGETHETGYWHGDHWHRYDETNEQHGKVVTPPVTASQKAEWEKFWKDQGLEPPPPGHGYRYDKEGKIAGLFKYNEPQFITGWSKEMVPGADFTKLTEAEWIRYHALRHIIGGSVLIITQEMLKQLKDDDPVPKAAYAPGVQELARTWHTQLRQKASGSRPYVSTLINWNRDPTLSELKAIAKKENELLESLQRPKRPRPEWQPYVEPLVKELETAIAADKRR
ncbi:MAG: hypothetical protein OXM61_04265 [Candidatus Poribacteria bacterium]|nr:hypothetical protein [Candidatus Poribacteria bacterium]